MIFDIADNMLKRGDEVWYVDYGRLRHATVVHTRKEGVWYNLGLIFDDGQTRYREHTTGKFYEVLKTSDDKLRDFIEAEDERTSNRDSSSVFTDGEDALLERLRGLL